MLVMCVRIFLPSSVFYFFVFSSYFFVWEESGVLPFYSFFFFFGSYLVFDFYIEALINSNLCHIKLIQKKKVLCTMHFLFLGLDPKALFKGSNPWGSPGLEFQQYLGSNYFLFPFNWNAIVNGHTQYAKHKPLLKPQ